MIKVKQIIIIRCGKLEMTDYLWLIKWRITPSISNNNMDIHSTLMLRWKWLLIEYQQICLDQSYNIIPENYINPKATFILRLKNSNLVLPSTPPTLHSSPIIKLLPSPSLLFLFKTHIYRKTGNKWFIIQIT